MSWMQKHALRAVIVMLPSLGLPVLEAMEHSCPVVTSNISSLPEAAGQAALFVNPEDVSDIAEKIYSLVIDENLRKSLIQKGKVQVRKFSWEKTAEQTLEVLEQVAKKGK